MHDRELEAATPEIVKAGLVASVASLGWTACTSAIAITLGITSGSAVLSAFGGVGLFDAFGSTALVLHFSHALRHESISEQNERRSQLVVACGLLIVGTATAAISVIHLAERTHTHASVLGVVISSASVFALGFLARRKQRIARGIPSRALLADSWLSAAGCATAAIAVAGTALNAILGWWWVDSSAALCIAAGAAFLGVHNLRQPDAGPTDPDRTRTTATPL